VKLFKPWHGLIEQTRHNVATCFKQWYWTEIIVEHQSSSAGFWNDYSNNRTQRLYGILNIRYYKNLADLVSEAIIKFK